MGAGEGTLDSGRVSDFTRTHHHGESANRDLTRSKVRMRWQLEQRTSHFASSSITIRMLPTSVSLFGS
jgi:hypothetical protein